MDEPEMEEINVNAETVINAATEDLYKTFRELRNFPQIFDFLQSVIIIDENRFRCTAQIDNQQERIVWDMEITEDNENRNFSWHSSANPDMLYEGSVNFIKKDLQKTEIRLQLHFFFPLLDDSRPYMLGTDFKNRVKDNLRRFKQAWEAGQFQPFRENLNELPDGLSLNQGLKRGFITEQKKGDSRKKNEPMPPPF